MFLQAVKSLSAIAMVLCLILPTQVWAQAATPAPAGGEQKAHTTGGPRKQLATIIFAGLGGAILGLSTLSFYGRPQDYLANLPIGFGIGIMAGTIFVTYRAVTNPQELYGVQPPMDLLDHTNSHALPIASAKPLGFNYSWNF